MGRLNPVTAAGYTNIIYTGDVVLSTGAISLHTALDGIDQIYLFNNDAAITIFIGDSTAQTVAIPKQTGLWLPFRRIEKIYVKSASATPSISVLALGS